MINRRISITYSLKWELIDAPQYKFTQKGLCINTRTGRQINKSLVGYTKGYYIKGKFISLDKLRGRLRKIEDAVIPF